MPGSFKWFLSHFPTRTLYAPLHSPIHAACPAHLILLDFITQIITGEEYRSLSCALCSFLHFLVTSSLLGPHILLNTLSLFYYVLLTVHLSIILVINQLNYPQSMLLPRCEQPCFTPIKNTGKIYSLTINKCKYEYNTNKNTSGRHI